MNIRDFSVFKAVAEEKNLTRASKLLYMTPQGVSKVIKNLELECDCELFSRTGAGMELSDCGKCFYDYAQKMESEYHDMRKEGDGMVLIPFSDGIGEEYEWKICMLTRKGEVPGNGVELFQKHVKEWLDLIKAGVITR